MVSEVDLDVEHWWQLIDSVILDVDLVGEVLHGGFNTLSDSLDHKTIDIVKIVVPRLLLLVRFNVLSSIFKSGHFQRLMELNQLIWRLWLHLSLEQWDLPLSHKVMHPSNIILHLLDEFIDGRHDVHC